MTLEIDMHRLEECAKRLEQFNKDNDCNICLENFIELNLDNLGY